MYHLTGVTTRCRSGRDGVAVRALDGARLYVEDGGALVVHGPAEAGPASLLRVLGGRERPVRGSVVLDGTDLATVAESRLARIRTESIGVVRGADDGLVPGLTAWQNVASALVPLRLRPADRQELAAEALAEVGLGAQTHAFPAELAEGERRRVALARALVKRPSVLLADEPTAGLDARERTGLVELFVRLWGERRVCCVVTTTDAALARRAPRLATLTAGRVTVLDGHRRTVPAVPSGGPSARPVEGRDERRDEYIRGQR
ncbi:ABC transporter ATP-binding protein [Streptomyces bugieae]|uniref:ATP-binding cassette domain-containing protein n=1 Tax=Streptomyces bugieae TaxID=3098223 RepID=A0ABU7P1T0_9ACTN|nr:ATP-binding cassette domain-containing protein [Streptomyces sp. DSM 41528]